MRLQEGISTFDLWVDGKRFNAAVQKYLPLSKTQEGQKQILQAARSGDSVAADFLFSAYKKIIAKAFWTYYLGPNKRYHQRRLEQGADADFASVAYNMLIGDEGTSPYKTFNPDKFTPEADLIKQFGYYLYRYLQNEAIKMIRAERMGGMTGNLKQGEDVSTVGYEDHFENSREAATADFSSDVDMKLTLEAFLKKLRAESPKQYQIFTSRLKGKSLQEIADELGQSQQAIRNQMKQVQDKYNDFVGGNN